MQNDHNRTVPGMMTMQHIQQTLGPLACIACLYMPSSGQEKKYLNNFLPNITLHSTATP